MNPSYPMSFTSIVAWAAGNGIPVIEARRRFAQYAVLRGIARSAALSGMPVFKGGNALDFVFRPNRSTLDLDFSVDMPLLVDRLDVDLLRSMLSRALGPVDRDLGILTKVQRVEQQPPGPHRTFITFHANIGYALPDESRLLQRMRVGGSSPAVVAVDVSLNEPICATIEADLGDGSRLRFSDIDDIVAEKLRALLQQPVRNRTRPQDLLDIALVLRDGPPPNLTRVAAFLLAKASARNLPVSRAAFRDPGVIERTRLGYDELEETTRRAFVPFDEALDMLLEFAGALAIPD